MTSRAAAHSRGLAGAQQLLRAHVAEARASSSLCPCWRRRTHSSTEWRDGRASRHWHFRAPISCPVFQHEYDGSKGSSDFMHSLLGEAGDHISEASVSDLNKTMEKARSAPASGTDGLRDMFMQIPGGGGGGLSRDMDSISNMNRGPGAKSPADMSPQELHAALWQVLTFRDNVRRSIWDWRGLDQPPHRSSRPSSAFAMQSSDIAHHRADAPSRKSPVLAPSLTRSWIRSTSLSSRRSNPTSVPHLCVSARALSMWTAEAHHVARWAFPWILR